MTVFVNATRRPKIAYLVVELVTKNAIGVNAIKVTVIVYTEKPIIFESLSFLILTFLDSMAKNKPTISSIVL